MSQLIEQARTEITDACEAMLAEPAIARDFTLKDGKICSFRQEGEALKFTTLCDPFEVVGRTYDENGENSATLVRFVTDRIKSAVIEVSVPISELISDPKKVVASLGDKGLWVSANRHSILKLGELLSLVRPAKDIVTVNGPGWHDGLFVSPTGDVFGENNSEFRLKSQGQYSDPQHKGELAKWSQSVEAALECANGDFLCIGLLSGLAGPIVNLCQDTNSVLINFAGTTSRGKTTAQRLGASVWGNPIRGAALVKFNVTPNAIEAIAERANGTLLAIDEGGQSGMSGPQYQTAVFNLAEGSGKHRLTSSAGERRVRRWLTCITISEEVGFADKVKRDGRNPAAGAVARIWEVDVDDAKRLDDKTISEIEDMKLNYGHAGPIFIQRLISEGYAANPETLRERVQAAERSLSSFDHSPQQRRVTGAAGVLLVAGEIAQEAGLIPKGYDLGATIKRVLQRSFERMARNMDPLEVALGDMRESIIRRSGYDVLDINYDKETVYREVAVQYGYPAGPTEFVSTDTDLTTDKRVYFIPVEEMMKLGGGNVAARAMAKELNKRGYLITPDKKNSIWQTMPHGEKIKHYRVSGAFFHEATEVAEALAEAV